MSINPATKKPSLTTTIPPINREPVELDGTPTSPHGPRFGTTTSALHRLPRADTLDSTGTPSSTTTTATSNSGGVLSPRDTVGAAAIAEANIEGARVGAGVDGAALRMNGQAVGNRTGEGELMGREEDDVESEELREQRAALLSSRSRDPAVLVDIPQTPAPEELAAVGAPSDAVDGETS